MTNLITAASYIQLDGSVNQENVLGPFEICVPDKRINLASKVFS